MVSQCVMSLIELRESDRKDHTATVNTHEETIEQLAPCRNEDRARGWLGKVHGHDHEWLKSDKIASASCDYVCGVSHRHGVTRDTQSF